MPGKKATPTTYRKKTAKKASSPIKGAPRESSVTLREDPLLYGAKQPRFIDLFCGIGGFRIAFERQTNPKYTLAGHLRSSPSSS